MTSAQVQEFLTMKQQAVLEEYIPEYEMAAADAGVVLLALTDGWPNGRPAEDVSCKSFLLNRLIN